jgi:hypothetical protein
MNIPAEDLEKVHVKLNLLILKTPTEEDRVTLTEANIIIMAAIADKGLS